MKLLVSPRDIEEAKAVIDGNADIIDVKNPHEGSLGANFPWIIKSIRALVEKERGERVKISAAIGDFDYKPGTAALAALGAASAGAEYIKVGLFKIKTSGEAIDVLRGVVKAVKDFEPTKKVVAAFYSDYKRIQSISPFEIAEIGREVDIDVAMVDTGIKDGRTTLEFLTEEELMTFISDSRALGLETALAGSLTFADLPAIKAINPDILGVRGMVCGGNRTDRVRAELVRELKRMVAE
ncbi:MAG: (5-formylfuran-3-yl)methyl phosphate synthase [Methanophagales archaeon ANME-1-THS]|nr:MAG: (5-formylfuran-3-yl)methyl phosphate synthase [Methanophagales archaeon ANME-1-THS]